jgi:hypothetical protein
VTDTDEAVLLAEDAFHVLAVVAIVTFGGQPSTRHLDRAVPVVDALGGWPAARQWAGRNYQPRMIRRENGR